MQNEKEDHVAAKGDLSDIVPPGAAGPMFKRMMMLYADRKIFLLTSFHLAMTVVVYGKLISTWYKFKMMLELNHFYYIINLNVSIISSSSSFCSEEI